jgi:D-alanine--poly(phosphoribitol) ligase subunit 2
MSAAQDLRDRVVRMFSGPLNLQISSDDTDLFESGVLDSLAFVELLLHLEREFGVTTSVDDLEVDNFRSIARIVEFVSARTVIPDMRAAHSRVVQIAAHR